MRRSKLYSLVALAASALAPHVAQAQLKDTQWIRPAMMLLVDTSGSMERKPDTSSCVDCLPTCNNSASDERNRWAITLEALTGTFTDYKCSKRERSTYVGQYDVSYFLPHYEFTTLSPLFTLPASQAQDGVLDSYKTRVKFGLMTFDGVSTTVNGATLVPFANYNSVKTSILGQPGQYSYPDAQATPDQDGNRTPQTGYGWKPLSFPGCLDYYGVNAGARGKGSTPGSLISVGAADDQTSVNTVNGDIQNALLQVRPYAGTPIAAMLDDLQYYLANDTDINSTDPFFGCRERYAILLTDGAPDAMFRGGSFKCDTNVASEVNTCATYGSARCQCPYDTEVKLAGNLIGSTKLAKLWVVAFNVNDTVALAALDDIALAAGTSTAYRSSNVASLRGALDDILSKTSPNSTSRSVPVVINTGRAVQLAGGKQFQISSGFKVASSSDTPWEGLLWRQRIECEASGSAFPQKLEANKGDIFHEKLNATTASARNILTLKPGLLNTRGTILSRSPTAFITNKTNVLKPDGTNFGLLTELDVVKDVLQTSVDQVSPTPVSFDSTMPVGYFDLTAPTRDNIVSFVRGANGTYREKHKLGDIYHSNPAVLPPIFPGSDLLSTFDPQLRAFYVNLIDATKTGGYWGHYDGAGGRPGAVFVATNDGLLHAFNLDDWKNKSGNTIDAGTELWAMMPPAAFSMMKAVATPSHQFVFDGTPVVKDVIMGRDTNGANNLSTVLVIGMRGLPAYVALDVTWPDEPKFLWQRSFGYLGDTTGTPQIANVRVNWNGSVQIRAVAILPGGEGALSGSGQCAVNTYARGKAPNTGARDNVRCWGLRGRYLYVVDMETGELIQEFDGRHFPSPVNGAVSVDGEELAVSRAAYFTDADGVLYRLSMNNTDPAKWRVMPIWDLYGGKATDFSGNLVDTTSPAWKNGRTATFAPVITRDSVTGNLSILVGTGDVDNLADLAANRVVSINEVRSYDSSSLEMLSSAAPAQNWALQLDAGESVTGPLAVLNDNVYFTSFTGPSNTNNKCVMGSSRIVGGHVKNKQSNGLPVAGLSPASGTGAYVLQYRPDDDDGRSLLLGLNISRDPVCFQGSAQNDPINASLGGRIGGSSTGAGAFQLRSLVAGEGGSALSGSAGVDKGQKMFTRTLPIPTVARSVGWASSVE